MTSKLISIEVSNASAIAIVAEVGAVEAKVTLMVMKAQIEVINHLYLLDQFCGFSGSFSSHCTLFGSTTSSATTVISPVTIH